MCVCVCPSITRKSAAYLRFMWQTKFYTIFNGVFNILTAWVSLKMLCSRVLASFAGNCRLPRSLASFRWTNETAMASFQLKSIYGYVVRAFIYWTNLTMCIRLMYFTWVVQSLKFCCVVYLSMRVGILLCHLPEHSDHVSGIFSQSVVCHFWSGISICAVYQ